MFPIERQADRFQFAQDEHAENERVLYTEQTAEDRVEDESEVTLEHIEALLQESTPSIPRGMMA